MLLVLAIRRPVREAFGPTIAYALWALPVLRMMLPPLPDDWRAIAASPIADAAQAVTYYVVEPMGGATPADFAAATPIGPALWPVLLLAAWAVGAIGFVTYHFVAHDRFTRRVRRMARSVRRVASGKVEVIETDAATGPLAFGIWRKYVAFPRDFADRYDPLERDLALAHELGHHARGDLIANWIALVVLGLHWFNPVAWRAFRAFRADQELACDALVLSGRAAGLRHAYGRAIVKSAHGGAVSAACHLHTINELKGRLKMLNVHRRASRRRLAAGGTALAALTLAGLGLTASGTSAAERVRTSVETAVGIDFAGIEQAALQNPMPPLPEPPASPAPIAEAAPPAPDGDKVKRRTRVMIVDRDGKTTDLIDDGERPAGAGVLPPVPPSTPTGSSCATRTARSRPANSVAPRRCRPSVWPNCVRWAMVPRIMSGDCKGSEGGGKMTFERRDGAKPIMVICTNRVEARAAAGAAAASAAEAAAAAEVARIDVGRIEHDAMRERAARPSQRPRHDRAEHRHDRYAACRGAVGYRPGDPRSGNQAQRLRGRRFGYGPWAFASFRPAFPPPARDRGRKCRYPSATSLFHHTTRGWGWANRQTQHLAQDS